jgi:hypothetical protein
MVVSVVRLDTDHAHAAPGMTADMTVAQGANETTYATGPSRREICKSATERKDAESVGTQESSIKSQGVRCCHMRIESRIRILENGREAHAAMAVTEARGGVESFVNRESLEVTGWNGKA